MQKQKHLYREGAYKVVEPEFEQRYGKEHGKEVYGAVINKVKQERAAKRRRQ